MLADNGTNFMADHKEIQQLKDSELTDTKFEKLSYNFITIHFYI